MEFSQLFVENEKSDKHARSLSMKICRPTIANRAMIATVCLHQYTQHITDLLLWLFDKRGIFALLLP